MDRPERRSSTDMLDAIENDRDPLATGEDARDALRVVDAAYASARAGELISIETESHDREVRR